jgi:hypothetical protein
LKKLVTLLAVIVGCVGVQEASAQQSLMAQQQAAARARVAAARQAQTMNTRAKGTAAPPFSSMMFGRTINSQVPYNPVGSEYRSPTGHVTAFGNFGGYYGSSSSIGLNYPTAGQSQRRR